MDRIELSSLAKGARMLSIPNVSNTRRTIAWLAIQLYMRSHPDFRQQWWDQFEQAVTQITEAVKTAVAKGDTMSELDIKSPVPKGMNPIEAGTVFVWRAQLVAQARLGYMLESGELVRPVEFGGLRAEWKPGADPVQHDPSGPLA